MKKYIKIFLIILGIIVAFFILSFVSLILTNKPLITDYTTSGTVYDSETMRPIKGVEVAVSSGGEDCSSGGGCKIRDTMFYTDENGYFEGKMIYYAFAGMNFKHKNYHDKPAPSDSSKKNGKYYLVKKDNPINLTSSSIYNNKISLGDGIIYLDNKYPLVITYSYELTNLPKNSQYIGISVPYGESKYISDKKISFPEGGLVYLGKKDNLYNELKQVPLYGYTNSEIDFKEGVYGFKTINGIYGKFEFSFFSEYISDIKNKDETFIKVFIDYSISPDGNNVESFL